MLLGTLDAILLGNLLTGKGAMATSQGRGINRAGKGKGINWAGEGLLRAGYGNNKMDFIITITNFEIQKYYQNEPRFNGVFSIDNLPKIKDGAYVKNLDEYSDIGTHWVALYVQNNNVTYFDSFGVEHMPKEIRTFISNKNITTNVFRLQTYDSIMCGYFCSGFIDFMLAGRTFTEFTNLCSPNNFKKKDDIMLNHFISNI